MHDESENLDAICNATLEFCSRPAQDYGGRHSTGLGKRDGHHFPGNPNHPVQRENRKQNHLESLDADREERNRLVSLRWWGNGCVGGVTGGTLVLMG